MNFIDIAILLVLGITILGGLYRGFVSTVYNIGATIVSLVIGRVCTSWIWSPTRVHSRSWGVP